MSSSTFASLMSREPPFSALLDHHLVLSTKNGSNTFIDFAPGEHPRRCLDIACGVRHGLCARHNAS